MNNTQHLDKGDEKYISIEYETWKNKYLPMEDENVLLRAKLEESKIKVTIYVNSMYGKDFGGGYHDRIGYVTFRVDKGVSVDIDNWSEVESTVLRSLDVMSSTYARWFTHEDVRQLIKRKEEYSALRKHQIEKINKLPRFWKWVFGINKKEDDGRREYNNLL